MNKNVFHRAKKKGMSNIDILRMKEEAKKAAETMEQDAIEKAMIVTMTIFMNLLIEDYWKKTAKKRVPRLVEQFLMLYDSFQAGVVDYEDCVAYVEEHAGITIETEWLKHEGNSNKVRGLGRCQQITDV